MAIRILSEKEQEAKDLREKTIYDYVKEGKTREEAKAIIEAIKNPSKKK
jgi:hypothetical protein